MPPKSKTTLTDAQKYEFCVYARDHKLKRSEYVDWIEQKWGVRVDESTITCILQTKDRRLSTEVKIRKRNGINPSLLQNSNLHLRSLF